MYKVYQRNKEGYVLFDQRALRVLQEYIQHAGECEAGGVLLGCYRGSHIEVVSATRPGPGDIRKPLSFIRRCSSHKQEALKQWNESDKSITYIGEWHTHPQIKPYPSQTDFTNWHRCLPNCDSISCIQGTAELWVGENTERLNQVQTMPLIH